MKITTLVTLIIIAAFAFPAAAKHHRQAEAEVLLVSEEYGNIETNATAETLTALGLEKGDTFPVAFGDTEVRVYLGDTYSDVPRGDFVAFITDQGNLRIARNYENAATALGVSTGDTITLFN